VKKERKSFLSSLTPKIVTTFHSNVMKEKEKEEKLARFLD
jgi:hypothetical protein